MLLDRPSADLFASLLNYSMPEAKHKRQNSDNQNFLKNMFSDKKAAKT